MNKFLLGFISIFFIISMTGLVLAASCTKGNYVYEGLIDSSGTFFPSSTPEPNANIRGYTCSNSACTSGTIWFGQRNTNSAPVPNHYLNIFYPSFPSHGYGIFTYKTGYIPGEYKATNCAYANTYHYLSRKSGCFPDIINFNVTVGSGTINVNFDVLAPIGHTGPLNFVPDEIKSHYTVDVTANLEVTKSGNPVVISPSSKTKNANFSGSKNFNFNFPATAGTYNIHAFSSTTDAKCLSDTPDNVFWNITVSPICGNSILESPEQCDDGNNANGDGCSSTCTIETPLPICGNSIIEFPEQCDDGNTVSGDGCSSTCKKERKNDDREEGDDTCEDICTGPWCVLCDGDYFMDGDAYLDSREELGSQQELGTLPTIQDLTSGKIKSDNDLESLSWITYFIVILLILLLILIIIISIFRR